MDTEISVVCVKWGDKYGPEYVNILRCMVRRQLLNTPHRFICFTDDTTGLRDDVETVELKDNLTGWWNKLIFFKPEVHDLKGKLLYLDLDVIIINPIHEMIEHPSDFIIIEDWAFKKSKRLVYNSSVFLLTIGSRAHVWEDFMKDSQHIIRRQHGDQNWITLAVKDADLWPERWCTSFKYNYYDKKDPRDGAKIVVFHGLPNPPQAVNGDGRGRIPPCPWITDFWKED